LKICAKTWALLGSQGREALVLGVLAVIALLAELAVGMTSW
jgi:hypothetical protein